MQRALTAGLPRTTRGCQAWVPHSPDSSSQTRPGPRRTRRAPRRSRRASRSLPPGAADGAAASGSPPPRGESARCAGQSPRAAASARALSKNAERNEPRPARSYRTLAGRPQPPPRLIRYSARECAGYPPAAADRRGRTSLGCSVRAQPGDSFAVISRGTKIGFIEARALEPQMNIVLPGEPYSTVHQHRAVRPAAVYLAEPRLCHRRSAGSFLGHRIQRVGRVPDQRARGLEVCDYLGGGMLEGLKRSDRLAELFTDLGVVHRHIQRTLHTTERVRGDCNRTDVENPPVQRFASRELLCCGAAEIHRPAPAREIEMPKLV